jgi:hypothetical protein
MVFLTLDLIKQELNEYMRAHFKTRITGENREILKAAWDKVILAEDLSEAETAAVKGLNVRQDQRQAFIAKLSEKYGAQFQSDPIFANHIQNMLRDGVSHLETFGYLEPHKLMEESQALALQQHRFFVLGRNMALDDTPIPSCCTLM